MFKKLSDHLKGKYQRRDELARQLEIVKVFDAYKEEIKKILPEETQAKPISLKNRILTVGVTSSVIANELRFYEQALIEKINSSLGKEAVRKVIYWF